MFVTYSIVIIVNEGILFQILTNAKPMMEAVMTDVLTLQAPITVNVTKKDILLAMTSIHVLVSQ